MEQKMRLRDEFVIQFEGMQVSTKEALEWYNLRALAKGNKTTFHRSNVYLLVIKPLVEEGRMVKLAHGVYQVNKLNFNKDTDPTVDLKLEAYLKSKIEKAKQ